MRNSSLTTKEEKEELLQYALAWLPYHLYEAQSKTTHEGTANNLRRKLYSIVLDKTFRKKKLSVSNLIKPILDDVRYALVASISVDDHFHITKFSFLYEHLKRNHLNEFQIDQLLINGRYGIAEDTIKQYKYETIKYQWYLFSAWVCLSFRTDLNAASNFILKAEKLDNVNIFWGDHGLLIKMLYDLYKANIISLSSALKFRSPSKIISYFLRNKDAFILDDYLSVISDIDSDPDKSDALKALVSGIEKDEDFENVLIATQEMIENDHHTNGPQIAIVSAIARRGNISQALEKALSIKSDYDQRKALCVIAEEIAMRGDLKRALKIVEQMKYDFYRSEPLAKIVPEIIRIENVQEALDIVERLIHENYHKAEPLCAIAISIAKVGDFERSILLVESISNGEYKSKALKGIAALLAKNGKFERSIELAEKINDHRAQFEPYYDIVYELAKAHHFDRAIDVAEKMWIRSKKAAGLVNIAIEMVSIGYLRESKKVFQQAYQITEEINDFWERDEAIKLIAPKLVRSGNSQEALRLANMIKDNWNSWVNNDKSNWPNKDKSKALGIIAMEIAQIGDIEKTIKIFHDSLDIMEKPKDNQDKSAFPGAIANINIKDANLQNAFKIGKQINWDPNDRREKPNPLVTIAINSAKDGSAKNAFAFIKLMEKNRYYYDALLGIIEAIIKLGDIKLAHYAVQFFGRWSWHGDKAFSAIALEFAKRGNFLEAFLLADKIQWQYRFSTSCNIAVELAKAGKFKKAIDILEKIIDWDDESKSIALAKIAVELAKAGQMVESNKHFNIAIKVARNINEIRDDINPFPGNKRYALSIIATELAKSHKTSEAISIVDQIEDSDYDSQKPWAYSKIAGIIAQNGNKNDARQVFLLAIDSTTKISWCQARHRALKEVSLDIAETKDHILIEEMLDQAIKSTQNIKIDWEKAYALAGIAHSYAAFNIEKSIFILSTLPAFRERMKFTCELANYFADDNNSSAIKKLIPIALEDFETIDFVIGEYLRCSGINSQEANEIFRLIA
ncbi:MAG: hypothetical protein DWQ05_14925 [Calditrichaeota bacterium]|nr:MAG: hypothetical protein DWQ05_14925 [Calditrichota bacterium]